MLLETSFKLRHYRIGIKTEFLPYGFDCFRQENSSLTRPYDKLGLELAIVRQLVELHGGTVNVTSSGEGEGATSQFVYY